MKILELELLETTLKFRSTVPFDLREIVPVLHVHLKVADLREIIPVLHVDIKVADRREAVNDVFIQEGFLCNVLDDRFIRLE